MNQHLALFMLAAIAFLIPSPPARGCGPIETEVVFTFDDRPDSPLEDYAAGKLGILRPSYPDAYLYAAYRHLNRVAPTPEEQRALVALWREKLAPPSGPSPSGVEEWLAARGAVPDIPQIDNIDIYRETRVNTHAYYLNCPPDAFATAARTLRARIDQFGATSPDVRDWVQAQDQVFANCHAGNNVPPPARAEAPALIQADRRYQIAAAHFYAQDFEAAEHAFRAITADDTSPWRLIAPYLVGRTLARKATLSVEQGADPTVLAQAEEQFRQVLSDGGRAATHPAAARLLNFVRFRSNPDKQQADLATSLRAVNEGTTLGAILWDYTLLLERPPAPQANPAPAPGAQDDLTDWLRGFHGVNKETLEHALAQWERTRSEAWLFAALTRIGHGHPKAPAVLAAGLAIGPESPAFTTAQYHGIRLLIAQGDRDAARSRLDALLDKHQTVLPPTALNRFHALRMGLAKDLDDFLRYAPRRVLGITAGEFLDEKIRDALQTHGSLDAATATLLNREFPLSLLAQASMSRAWPARFRREIALTAWVKAVLLEDEETARRLVTMLRELAPELTGALDAYQRGPDRATRQFTAIHTILRFPALRPSIPTNNLGLDDPLQPFEQFSGDRWCSALEALPPVESGADATVHAGEPLPPRPGFLTPPHAASAQTEWEKLAALPIAPNTLAARVLQYAAAKPDDPRVPEALHLAVQRTRRITCKDDETTKFSKQAFQLLHRRYPKSEWAIKTKYHY